MTIAETAVQPWSEVLTPQLRRFLVGVGGGALGGGLTTALLLVYLHEVRGLSTALAGLVLAFMAVVGLAAAGPAGVLVDRWGPRPVLLIGTICEGIAVAAWGFVTSAGAAFALAAVVAVGGSMLWSPQNALVAALAAPEHRQRVYGLQFMLLNLGIGVGGLVGSIIVDVDRPATFVVLYLLDGLTYLIYFAMVLSLRGYGGPVAQEVDDATSAQGYRDVVRDRALQRLVFGSLILLTCGYGSVEAGIAAYVTQVADLPVNVLGVVFAANTGVIVIAQLTVIKRIAGRSRVRLLTAVGALWSVSWLLVGVSAFTSPVGAVVALLVGVAVFALGETLFAPVQPALLNDLAPDHLRGRYNALSSVTWGVSNAIGPAVAGVMIGAGLGVAWAVVVAAGCLAGGLVLGTLRARLTPAQDGRLELVVTDSAP